MLAAVCYALNQEGIAPYFDDPTERDRKTLTVAFH
jgi:hypothetical protein